MKRSTHRKLSAADLAARDERIRSARDQGVTLKALVQRFGLGTTRIMHIVGPRTAPRQGDR